MSIELKAGHDCGPVLVEIEHRADGKKAVMFEQDNECNKGDVVSMDFEEIDALIGYLQEQQQRLKLRKERLTE